MQWPRHAASADCRESRSATSRQCASRLLISGARETPGSFGPRTFIFKVSPFIPPKKLLGILQRSCLLSQPVWIGIADAAMYVPRCLSLLALKTV